MTWNYRVVRVERGDYASYELAEVYYHDSTGEIEAWAKASAPAGDDPDDLRGDVEVMLAALDRPVLTTADLPGYTDEWRTG